MFCAGCRDRHGDRQNAVDPALRPQDDGLLPPGKASIGRTPPGDQARVSDF
jgi:hypothetical protein